MREAFRSACFLLALLVTCFVEPGQARAFRTLRDRIVCLGNGCEDQYVVHFRHPIFVEWNPTGLSDLPVAEVDVLVERAYGAWAAPSCTGLDVRFVGVTDAEWDLDDGRNVVGFVATGWRERGYSSGSIAVTTQKLYEDENERWFIASADTEINHAYWYWTTGPTDLDNGLVNLPHNLVHEAGHAFGVMHPCEDFGRDFAPDCNDLRPTLPEIPIMWPFASEIDGDHLRADDIDAICTLYPRGQCTPPCGDGMVCDERTGACRRDATLPRRCNDDASCGDGFRCDGGMCVMAPDSMDAGTAEDDASVPSDAAVMDADEATDAGDEPDGAKGPDATELAMKPPSDEGCDCRVPRTAYGDSEGNTRIGFLGALALLLWMRTTRRRALRDRN